MSRSQRVLSNGRHGLAIRNNDSYAAQETPDSPLVDFVRRWWVLLVIGTALGAAGGYVYGKLGPTSYQSLALLQVRADPSSSRPASDGQIAALAFAAEAIAPPVLNRVSQSLQQQGTYILPIDLQLMTQTNKLTVQPVKGSSALTITATYDDPSIAQSLADNLASAVVDDAASQAKAESDNRHKELQDNLDRTHEVLSSAQLYQHEQELQQRLQTQQALLLQLQTTYQQSLQQQVQVALLLRQAQPTTTDVPTPTADQQRQLNNLSATSTQALSAELAMLKDQQNTAQSTMDELDGQLASVRAQLNGLPDPTAATPTPTTAADKSLALDATGKIAGLQDKLNQLRDQQGQELQLEKREHDLQLQSNDLHNQARTLQTQTQQAVLTQQAQDQQRQLQQQQITSQLQVERSHLSLLKATLDTIVPLKDQTDLNNQQQIQLQSVNTQIGDSKSKIDGLNAQQQQLAQSAGTSATTAATVALLQKQLQDTQAATTSVDAQLADAQSQRAALQKTLGPNPTGAIQSLSDQITQLQQQQRAQDLADSKAQTLWTTLKQQEQDLVRQRETARGQLLEAQRQQQQDIQRRTDLSQHDIQAQVAQAPRAAPATNPDSDLMNTSADLRDGLLGQLRDQQQQVTASIADVMAQLDQVHKAQAALPDKMDPVQATIQSTVAAQRLTLLTQELTRLLVAEANGVGPLERFGPAAPATAVAGSTRMLPFGAAAGFGVAAVLAFLVQLVVNARRSRWSRPSGGNGEELPTGRVLARRESPLTSSGIAQGTTEPASGSA